MWNIKLFQSQNLRASTRQVIHGGAAHAAYADDRLGQLIARRRKAGPPQDAAWHDGEHGGLRRHC